MVWRSRLVAGLDSPRRIALAALLSAFGLWLLLRLLLRLRVPAGGLVGLVQDSDVMVDKLTTVRRSNVQARIGRLSSQQMVELERLMMTFLGMAR